MGEQTKNMLIGIFVIGACAVIVWLALFLKPSVGDGKQTLYVRFANINQINVGTRVLFSGKAVGEVVAIEEIPEARQKTSADILGEIYFYQLTLKIDSRVRVYDTDEIKIQTSGLLGERSIAIIPMLPPKGVIPKLITSQPIYADSVDPIERAFNELSKLADDMQETFKEVTTWIQINGDDMGDTVRSVGDAMDEAKIALKSINDEHIVDDVKIALKEFKDTFCEVKDAISTLKKGDAFVNATVVLKNMKNTSHNMDMITTHIADGKGTLGKLIKGDDLYLHMTAIMSKIDTMMNDINHYGILFHLNKNWQRQRTQRVTALNALNTPQSFKNYFETEVADINTAMSRISMLIDKAELSPAKEQIFNDVQFQRDFCELLRQAEALSENLKLYNEQLSEAIN